MLAAVALTSCAVLGVAATASAATVGTTANYACQASTPVGTQTFSLSQGATVTAPDEVAPGGDVQVVIAPAPTTIPSSVNGYTVKQLSNVDLKVPIPANSSYVSATLSGGSGLGSTPPSISVSIGIADLHVAGPIAGGSTVQLPTITVDLTAGSSGTIQTQLYGSSYSDPGLTFTATVSSIVGDINAPSSCYPNPNSVITTTTIQ
ncbi:MAG: cyclase [Sciscionella sp.]|nr:cyclase [Sciscionella sp.]